MCLWINEPKSSRGISLAGLLNNISPVKFLNHLLYILLILCRKLQLFINVFTKGIENDIAF